MVKSPALLFCHPSNRNQSLLLVPQPSHPTSTQLTTSAPSAPGVPDPLRSRLGLTTPINSAPETQATTSSHPLEARLTAWRAMQDSTKYTVLGRQYGIAEPVRRRLELADCARGEWRPAVLGGEGRGFGSVWGSGSSWTGTGVHADILLGREAEVAWEDVFVGCPLKKTVGFHEEMEARSGMNSW